LSVDNPDNEIMKRLSLLTLCGVLLLAGCSTTPEPYNGPTLPATQVGEKAAEKMDTVIGVKPAVACGDNPVPAVDEYVLTCDMTDPGSQAIFDADVTIHMTGADTFEVDVNVADKPKFEPVA